MSKAERSPEYAVIVVGGGPSGLLAATMAAKRGLSVLVAEKMDMPGRKLRITGKGRCNVTNACDRETFFSNIRSGARFLQSSYCGFDCEDVQQFFESNGVALKIERGNRVFPVSDHADDVADALVAAAKRSGCDIRRLLVKQLLLRDGAVCGVVTESGSITCRGVIVATGGRSYPATGSTGDGYRFAESAGHSIVAPQPSLVPLCCAGNICAEALGLSLKNVQVSATQNGKRFFCDQGEMLFTHFGVSGPLILSLSAALVGRGFDGLDVRLDLKPGLEAAQLDKRVLRDFSENLNREFRNSLDALLPRKMIPLVIAQSGIAPEKRVHSITAAERAALVGAIKAWHIPVTSARPIEEAVITAGGVELREINPKTMESKRIKNLHFVGEVLDIDGFTGGFNLSIAFATGHAAGQFILD